MTTQRHQGITKILVSAAIALAFCVGGTAPASADPNPIGNGTNPFGGLSCSCPDQPPAGRPDLTEDIDRGLREGHTTWLPGLPAPVQHG